ncbi:hypothetical protein O988_04136 [Pseudogymnoascus sp. VKM F-3808]|nr:hypothetical protein V490_03565 [Pseudogymnoascus sp. VKM F-3557]KFX98918.1 hypothetical protein O988_04136 [Pseudogymnoascus sp. VKM F-3808]
MNTVKSFWVGWGSLCVAGGTAYFFAKRSINEDRQTRFREAEEKKRRLASLEQSYGHSDQSSRGGGGPGGGSSTSPSQEANLDPAPTRHEPGSDAERAFQKSKYEASQPYQTKKGDRFS